MARPITLDDLIPKERGRGATGSEIRRLRSGPGEFTLAAVVWGGLGLFAISQGFADDKAPLVLVGATSLAFMIVGSIWPIVALRSVRVVVNAPTDAIVGSTIRFEVALVGRARNVALRFVEPPGPWQAADAPCRGQALVIAPHRGVYEWVRVEVKCGGPMHVFVRHRHYALRLGSPLYIAPAPIFEPVRVDAIDHDVEIAHPTAGVAASDAVRSTREYVVGDPARSVHWPSTAHTGALVVREFEPPAALGVAIVLKLRAGAPERMETAVARASGAARAVLAQGGRCVIVACTPEPSVTAVDSMRSIDRALAAVEAGDPGGAPPGWPVLEIAS